MTPTFDMADTGHNTDNIDFLGHWLFSPSSNSTSSRQGSYQASQIQWMEIPETGIDFALPPLTWTSQQMEYLVNDQEWIIMD